MLICSDFSEKFALHEYKKKMIDQFTTVCMNCLKSFTDDDDLKLVKIYKDEKFKMFLKIRHLAHYSCKECSLQKSK